MSDFALILLAAALAFAALGWGAFWVQWRRAHGRARGDPAATPGRALDPAATPAALPGGTPGAGEPVALGGRTLEAGEPVVALARSARTGEQSPLPGRAPGVREHVALPGRTLAPDAPPLAPRPAADASASPGTDPVRVRAPAAAASGVTPSPGTTEALDATEAAAKAGALTAAGAAAAGETARAEAQAAASAASAAATAAAAATASRAGIVSVEPDSPAETAVVAAKPAEDADRAPAVVLVHGIMGFDHVQLFRWRFHYFRGVADHLRRVGVNAYVVRVPALEAIPARALALAEFVKALPHRRVTLVAHSMGGLDARYAITRLGLAERVPVLVTVATPHRGTPLADLLMRRPARFLRKLAARLGARSEAVECLTPERMARFNEEVPDAPGVTYACVPCGRRARPAAIHPFLRLTHAYLRRVAGPNDGLVPVSSQLWGAVVEEIEADHWAQVGWSRRFDAPLFYADVVVHLAQLGLLPPPSFAELAPGTLPPRAPLLPGRALPAPLAEHDPPSPRLEPAPAALRPEAGPIAPRHETSPSAPRLEAGPIAPRHETCPSAPRLERLEGALRTPRPEPLGDP